MSVLDNIAAEVANLTDEQIAEAASKLLAQRQKAQSAVSPERKAKMKEQEKARRQKNNAIIALAREKGLVPPAKRGGRGASETQPTS